VRQNHASPSDNVTLIDRLLAAPDAASRAVLIDAQALDIDLIESLKAEIERVRDTDVARAVAVGEIGLEIADRIGTPEARALACFALGLALNINGEFDRALVVLEEARGLYLKLGRKVDAARIAVRQLQALAVTGRYEEALERATEAAAVLESPGHEREYGRLMNNIGNINQYLGRFEPAEKALERARRTMAEVGDPLGLAQAHVSSGKLYAAHDRFREALEHYQTGLELFTTLDQTRSVAGTNTLVAALFQRQGRLALALERLSRARQMFADLGLPVDAAQAQLEEVRVRNELNLIEETETMASEIVEVFRARSMTLDRAEALFELGTSRARAHHPEAARETLEESRQAWLEIGNSTQAALVEVSMAALELSSDQPLVLESARARAAQAADGLERAGARSALAFALLILADAHSILGASEDAIQTLERADAIAHELGVPDLIVQTTWRLGRASAEQGHALKAESRFREVIDQLEQVRASLSVDDFKSAYLEDKLTVYGDLVSLLIDQQRMSEALEFAERAKSRALLDQLSRNLETDDQPSDPEIVRVEQRLNQVRQELNASFMRSEVEREATSARGASLDRVLELEREVTELIRELERRRLVAAPDETAPDKTAPSARELLGALEPDATLVEYFEVGEELIAFVVEGGQVRAVRGLMPDAEVRLRLERLEFTFARVANPGPYAAVYTPEILRRQVDGLLTELFDGLIGPLGLRLEGHKLIIVPHGALSAVPFSALKSGDAYLIDRARISLAPSLAVYAACVARESSPSTTLAAFGIPSKEIPAVAEEVRTVARVFPGGRAFVGEEASFAAFFQYAPEASVLHIATHGAFRPDNPMFSGLKLADGWLSARDLYQLRLRGSLTVLSACESGLGASSGGEVLGLARGFLHAGAPALVVSLWPVQDEQTALLMTTFYTRLHDGQRVADAMRGAQLELREHHDNPFHWGAFTVTGDPNRAAMLQPARV
jgi:tetratricopeptide (TPR) repeat protein